MGRLIKNVLLLSSFVLLTGCASNMTVYTPPTEQLAAKEFYSVELHGDIKKAESIIKKAMASFSWLSVSSSPLTYTGKISSPPQAVDCGKLITYTPLTTSGHGQLDYAQPNSKFMGESSANELSTSLDATVKFTLTPVKESIIIAVNIDYRLNRELIERRTMFGVESRPAPQNTPIIFSTLEQGSGADGATCRSKLTLEQKIIRAIAEQQ